MERQLLKLGEIVTKKGKAGHSSSDDHPTGICREEGEEREEGGRGEGGRGEGGRKGRKRRGPSC